MEILSKCFNICSSGSGNVTPGSYAYEAFKKIPAIAGFANIFDTIQKITGAGGQSNRRLISMDTVTNIAGNFIQQKIGQKINIQDFIRLQPQASVKQKQSNLLKLISNDDVVVKKIKKSNYQQLISQFEKKQPSQKFTDPQFPPEPSSIGSVDGVKNDTPWKRISQIIKNPEFVSGKIQPSDILQGTLGNCYFLSAIAALAQNDFRIKNIFPSLSVNSRGIYMARIMFRGVIHQVVVDDYIPVNAKNQPIFAKPSGGNQIWVMILQKCWAKLNKNYGQIVGGLPNEVLHAFSGAPTFYRKVRKEPQKQQQLWKQILQLQRKGGVLCCGTSGDASIQKVGLVKGHAYTILGVYQNPRRMLKIRNPWGSRQWLGKLSQRDTDFWNSLSEQQIRQLGFTKNNDGIFFMSWQDFMDYFVMIDICKVNDNANYLNVDVKFDKKNGQMFEFETEGGDVTIGLSQRSLRSQDSKREALGYSRSTLVVGREIQSGKYEYIDSSSFRLFSDHYLELYNIPKGKYVIFAKFDWMFNDFDQGTVSVYSQSKTILKQSKQASHPKFLHRVFQHKARSLPTKKAINNNKAQYSSQFLFTKGGYGYYFIQVNKDSDKSLKIQLNQKDFAQKLLVLKKPHKGQTLSQTIKPGESALILYRLKTPNYPNTVQVPNPKITVV